MSYTHFDTAETKAEALKLAKGAFQVGLLSGVESWSAMTVRSAKYRGRYIRSGKNLLARLEASGFKIEQLRGDHGRKEFRISA